MSDSLDTASLLVLLADVSVVATLFAILAELLLRALRVKDASLTHTTWLALTCGMLVFPVLHFVLPAITIPLVDSSGKGSGALGLIDPAWVPWIFAVYASVVSARLLLVVVGIALSFRLSRTSLPLDGLWASYCAKQFSGSLLRRRATIGVSACVRVPMTTGFVRPRILLPVESEHWSAEKMRSVLAHELAHVRRGDCLWQIVSAVNGCLFWFHPIAWVLERRLSLAAERACDESAIRIVGDNRTYARHLVDIAANLRGRRGRVLVSGLLMATAGQMDTRIEAILDSKRNSSHRASTLAAAAVFLVASVLWAGAASISWQSNTPTMDFPSTSAPEICPNAESECTSEGT
jgi:beta-lactamase regulating signal transducer with metallopeptidase domain